jgi:hypothetical protein
MSRCPHVPSAIMAERSHTRQARARHTLQRPNKFHILLQMSMIFLIADFSSLKLDQTPHNRSAISPTNALVFRTFSFLLPQLSFQHPAHLQDA